MKAPLERLERWMLTAVTHPGGVRTGADAAREHLDAGGEDIEQVVAPSAHLTAAERLGIYSSMIGLRLVEVLANDFPTVRAAMGHACFDEVARAYLVAYPSRYFSLNRLGIDLPRYLEQEAPDLENRAFLAELATLERTIEELFDAPHEEALDAGAVQAIAPEAWATARLTPVRALRVLSFRHDVDEYVRSTREGENPKIPAPRPAGEAPYRVVVWRGNWRMWRKTLDPAQDAVLCALASGATLVEAIERAAELPGVDEGVLASVGEWFQEWCASRMFARVAT